MKTKLWRIYIKYLNFCEFWINTLHLSILAPFLKFEKKNQLVTRIFVCCLFNWLILCKALKRHSEVQVHGFFTKFTRKKLNIKEMSNNPSEGCHSSFTIWQLWCANYLMEPFHSEDIHSIMVTFITRSTLFN